MMWSSKHDKLSESRWLVQNGSFSCWNSPRSRYTEV